MKKIISTQLLTAMLLLISMHVVAQHSNYNSIKRIDSLTHVFMENTLGTPMPYLTTDEILTLSEERFYRLVDSMATVVPFKFDQTVRTQMHYMKNPASSFLTKASLRKNLYFRVFEEVLDKKGMPDEIKYLSIVESLLSTNAESWCGATGLWQFMPATGRMMDLSINQDIDERKDIYKSTEKACDYLLSMYNLYGDWLLALAAYNGGPGNVNKAIRHSGGKRTFWEIKNHLPKETQNYVPKFLATTFLMTFSPPNPLEDSHLLKEHETLVPVVLCCEVDLKYICALVEISDHEQLEWNSVYKNGFIPANIEAKKIVLPYNKAMKLAAWQDSVYTISSRSFMPSNYIKYDYEKAYYKAKKGQTLSQIADIHGVSISNLKKWNHIKSSKIAPGKTLLIQKRKESVLPVNKIDGIDFLYYITDYEYQTISDICSRFPEFDIIRTCQENQLSDMHSPIGKGKLIKLYFTNTI
ncbi:MAG: transglycosylase SLT domain-containing protein [Bacteroidota bacterium]|nr:transglycosylase SLT domain-containing protein [Bacteroidota bacterium]